MAAHLSSMRERKVRPRGIMSHMSSVACEWLLIFLLFVDAVFSYLLQEFAKYCELQTPCPLCSRLVFGKTKLGGCSWSLVCRSHKEEFSSLHSKLADAHGTCLCCKKTWMVATSDDESLLELKLVGLGGYYKANVEPPLVDVPVHRRFSRQDGVKKLRSKLRASMKHRTTDNSSLICDSHSICERNVELRRRDHLAMPENDVLVSDELKNVYCSSSNSMIGRAPRESGLAEPLQEIEEAISLECVQSVPSASTTLRVTEKSIYIEELSTAVNTSAVMNIEATAGFSSDESTYSSNSYIKTRTGSFCCRTKSTSPVSTAESSLFLKDLDGVGVSDHDQSCKKSLYKELEEERKAAGVAASQAMAMITRLQEEKAAIEMEAVQCIRLMELRVEYYLESLERASNLLSAKEKELHDLQNEVEFYRNNFCVGSGFEDLHGENENTPGDSESARFSKENGECERLASSVSKFGDEKLYISHSLEKLVKNLYKDYCSDNVQDSLNGLVLYEIKDGVAPRMHTHC